MTKHKEKEEDIIKEKNSEHEEKIELADMEKEKAEAEEKKEDQVKKYEFFQISQKAVVYNPADKKFLIVRDKNTITHDHEKKGGWNLPGGRLSTNELLEKGLIREIREELGEIEYEMKGIIDSIEFKNADEPVIVLYNLVEFKGGEIILSGEHRDFKWILKDNVLQGDYSEWLKRVVKKSVEQIESQEYLNGWKRAQADFENYKKRQAESQKEFAIFASQDLVMRILPVLDNFHASTDHIPEDQKENPWVTGIMHIQKQLENVLKENGVEEIETKEGDEFNPGIHEAVKSDANDTNKISKVLSKGYKIGPASTREDAASTRGGDKVIRPAKVIVS